MELDLATNENVATLRLIGQLWQFEDLKNLEDAIMQCISKQHPIIIVDVSRLTFINSQGLGLFVRIYSKVKQTGSRLIVYKPTGNVQETIELSGFDSFMELAINNNELETLLNKKKDIEN